MLVWFWLDVLITLLLFAAGVLDATMHAAASLASNIVPNWTIVVQQLSHDLLIIETPSSSEAVYWAPIKLRYHHITEPAAVICCLSSMALSLIFEEELGRSLCPCLEGRTKWSVG